MTSFFLLIICVFADEENESCSSFPFFTKVTLTKSVECLEVSETNDYVTVHYIGKSLLEEEFENTYLKNKPFSFTLGVGEVIKGWDKGLVGMCVGEKRRLLIPFQLAYGEEGDNYIEPNMNLKYEVEMIKILKYESIKKMEDDRLKRMKEKEVNDAFEMKRKSLIKDYWNGKYLKKDTNNSFGKKNIKKVLSLFTPAKTPEGEKVCCSSFDGLAVVSGEWRSVLSGEAFHRWDKYHIRLGDGGAWSSPSSLRWVDHVKGMCVGDRKKLLLPPADARTSGEEIERRANAEGGVEFDFDVVACELDEAKYDD